ncbi:MAG: crossover junction endodeoxyribonuclease RuvC [Simkaniaceae bacterium]
MEKKEIILGIDPGTRITGFGIIECTAKGPAAIDYGCIRIPTHAAPAEKYFILFSSIEKLLLGHGPASAAIESQFVYKNSQSALKLGMAKGAAMIACAKHGIPIFEYTPKKAKLAVTGKGSSSKDHVQKMIQILLKLPGLPTPADAADALSLALCHWQNNQWQAKIRK